jgi:hypothetical protein
MTTTQHSPVGTRVRIPYIYRKRQLQRGSGLKRALQPLICQKSLLICKWGGPSKEIAISKAADTAGVAK